MAILRNAEVWFLKADPARPNKKFTPANPTWECQIRTRSRDQKKEWELLGLPVKTVDDDEGVYYRVNLKKNSIKKDDGKPASPVEVVNGRREPIDPNTVGNGSTAHIRIWQYEYDNNNKKGKAAVLMGLQIITHKLYTPKARSDDDFGDEGETEVIPEEFDNEEDSESPAPEREAPKAPKRTATAAADDDGY